MEKIRFNSDYIRAAHPAVLEGLMDIQANSYGGYGIDEECEAAKAEIRKYIGCPDADIHFIVGGTQANFIGLDVCLTRKYHGVICASSGHINVHEAGSVENTGHKLIQLPHENGKIDASQIEEVAEEFRSSYLKEHVTEPKAVYISFPTEYGTIYSKKELEAIRAVCDEYGLYLFIDGARLGYALAGKDCDVSLEDISRFADVYYIGGTKCGALFGEAVVFTKPELAEGFRGYMKMNGALLAKGFLLGNQFKTLFKDGLYFEITGKAVEFAQQMMDALEAKGIKAGYRSGCNIMFYELTKEQIEKLEENFVFEAMEKVDDTHYLCRFCASWGTTQEEVDAFVAAVEAL